MRISDWSSDVCSSDLLCFQLDLLILAGNLQRHGAEIMIDPSLQRQFAGEIIRCKGGLYLPGIVRNRRARIDIGTIKAAQRSEEHTSELQSLMRISYAVFCLNKKTPHT